MKVVATGLGDLTWRERKSVAELLMAACEYGLPQGFLDKEIAVAFDTKLDRACLTNSDGQICMMNEEKLETYYRCPYSGAAGFAHELRQQYYEVNGCMHELDVEFLLMNDIISTDHEDVNLV